MSDDKVIVHDDTLEKVSHLTSLDWDSKAAFNWTVIGPSEMAGAGDASGQDLLAEDRRLVLW